MQQSLDPESARTLAKSRRDLAGAISAGIEECLEVEQASEKLAKFLNALRATGWTEEDVQVVEEAVETIATAMASRN